MRIALAGRPGAGKTSLFNLVAASASSATPGGSGPAAPRPSTISAKGGLRLAHVDVPDPRLWELSAAYRPRKTTAARLQFEDLEQKSAPVYPALSTERRDMLARTDLILLVIDLFSVDPPEWAEAARIQWMQAQEEFVLCDLAVVETRLEKVQKLVRIGQKPAFPSEIEVLTRLRESLEAGQPVRSVPFSAEETRALRGYAFLSEHSMFPAFNLDESHLAGAAAALSPVAAQLSPAWIHLSAEVEAQIQELPSHEQTAFLEAFGLSEPAVAQMIRAAYNLAGLHCFFTVGEDEVRAWSLPKGSLAPEAAGVIHSDLEKSFVRAEVLRYEDWLQCRTTSSAKEKGLFRLEGRDYEVQDGDILNIRSGLAKGRG